MHFVSVTRRSTDAHCLQEEKCLTRMGYLHERLLAEGRLSKVKYPPIGQGVMAFPQPNRTKTERRLVSKINR